MKLLEDKIMAEGLALSDSVLKVDSFINHQVDPVLMQEIGRDFAEHFKDAGITRVAEQLKVQVLHLLYLLLFSLVFL